MMMSDIVEWLRKVAPQAKAQDPLSSDSHWWSLTDGVIAAANEIERLRKERDRWFTVAHCLMCYPTHDHYCPQHTDLKVQP